MCTFVWRVKETHHYEVPHASSFGHDGGDTAAARHQDDLDGLGVQKVVQQLGRFTRVTLEGQSDKALHGWIDEQMDGWINNKAEKWIEVMEGEKKRERDMEDSEGGKWER